MDYRDYYEGRYGRQGAGEGERGGWGRPDRYRESERDYYRHPDYGDVYDREAFYRDRDRYRDQYRGPRDPRGLMERAADEMRSWFGDESAERRRQRDEQFGGRDRGPRYGRDAGAAEWADVDERRWARQWGYIDPAEEPWTGRPGYGAARESGVYPGVASEAGPFGTRSERAGYGPSRESGVYPGVSAEASGWNPARSHSAAWSIDGPFTGRGPRSYRRSDERIREDLCDRLWQHGGVDASDLEVSVNDGEVTMQGTVEDRGQRRAAEALAESVWGVQQVQNLIRVGRGLRSAPEARRREEPGRAA